MPSVEPDRLAAAADGEASEIVRGRVAAARAIAQARQGCANARLAGVALDLCGHLDDAAARLLPGVAVRLGWSARGFHRVLRVARTIADLAGSDAIAVAHLAEAVQYRRVLQAQ